MADRMGERRIRRTAVMRPATVLSRNDDGTYECEDLLTKGTFRASKANPFDEFIPGTRVLVSPQNSARVTRGAGATIQSRAPQEQKGVGLFPRSSIAAYTTPVPTSLTPNPIQLQQGGASVAATIYGFFLSEEAVYSSPEITDATAQTVTASQITLDVQASASAPLGLHSLTIHGVTFDNAIEVSELTADVWMAAGTGTSNINGSLDGLTWSARSTADYNVVRWVSWLNLWVAVSGYAGKGTTRVLTSPDGVTWTPRTASVDMLFRALADDGSGVIVAIGVSSAGTATTDLMTSPDGINWTTRTAAASGTWVDVAYGAGVFTAVSNDGQVMTSPDGVTWTSRTPASANSWDGICFGASLFVAVANSGASDRVMTSPDGITWTTRTPAAALQWRSVCYASTLGLFVAVAASGTGNRVMTSPDGITWTSRTSAADNSWQAVAFGGDLLVAVSSTGTNCAMTSPDGITWTSRALTYSSDSISYRGA